MKAMFLSLAKHTRLQATTRNPERVLQDRAHQFTTRATTHGQSSIRELTQLYASNLKYLFKTNIVENNKENT
jgi:hypothetical protein